MQPNESSGASPPGGEDAPQITTTACMSAAWADAVFEAPPRRKVEGRSRATQRHFLASECCGRDIFLEGGNEFTAGAILEHWWRMGFLHRFKFQPFCLSDLSLSSDGIPDILIQMADGRYFAIEIKSARYFTSEKEREHHKRCELLASVGLPLLLWTDTSPLCRTVWHAARHVQRGTMFPLTPETQDALRLGAERAETLGDLMRLPEGNWDALMSAVALGIFSLNFKEVFDENSKIYRSFPAHLVADFLGDRPSASSWWGRLPDR